MAEKSTDKKEVKKAENSEVKKEVKAEVKKDAKPAVKKEAQATEKDTKPAVKKETQATEKDTKPAVKKETQATEKAVKPTKKKDEPVKDDDRVYHVSRRRLDHMWQVKAEGSSRSLKKFFTQEEAVEYAKKVADNNEGRIVIHKVDGSFKKLKY